jgi:phenylacetate-CoA ligase
MAWKESVKKWIAAYLPDEWMALTCHLAMFARYPFWRKVRKWREFLSQSQHWSEDELLSYQWNQIKKLLHHAYENIPYYRQIFREMDAHPEDFRDFSDFEKFPTLTKADLQEHLEDLVAMNCPPHRRVYTTTGGSTGIPVGMYFDKVESYAKEWAFITTLWRRVGYRDVDRIAVMRGEIVSKGQFWEKSPFQNRLIFSTYHLTDDKLPLYLKRLREFRPKYIHAYPSSIIIVAKFMLERQEPPVECVRAILCGSENLYDWQRQLIEQAFQCRVYSWYGQTEKVCLAGECEHSSKLHIFPEYGFTELLDEAGNKIEEPGIIGEIVATGFLSCCMPLIRYRTMDMASYAPGYCELCGRRYRLFERIEGRLQEFIVTATGRYISMTAINMHSPVFDNVRQFRFYQDTPGKVILKIVPKNSYGEQDEANIRRELALKLGPDVELIIELVDEIPRTLRGKYRFLEQKLPLRFGDR